MKEEIKRVKNSKNEVDRRHCLQLLEAFLLSHSTDAEAWYDKASCHDFLGEEGAAEPCYRKCYELGWEKLPEQEQASFFVGFGSTLRNNEKLEESIAILREGAKRFPDYAPIKVFLALSLFSANRHEECGRSLFSAILESSQKGLDGYERAIQFYLEALPSPEATE